MPTRAGGTGGAISEAQTPAIPQRNSLIRRELRDVWLLLQIGLGVLVGSGLAAPWGLDSAREVAVLLATIGAMLTVGLLSCACRSGVPAHSAHRRAALRELDGSSEPTRKIRRPPLLSPAAQLHGSARALTLFIPGLKIAV